MATTYSLSAMKFHLINFVLQLILLPNSIVWATSVDLTNTTLALEHRSNPNITILHEVHEEGFSTKKDKPPSPEILPLKPIKKKPYLPLEKSINIYEKTKPLKELELHPVVFDFNLGDLEDLEHETFKKKDLSAEEKLLLRDGEFGPLEIGSTLTYSDDVKIPDAETLQDDLAVQVDFLTSTANILSTLSTSTTANEQTLATSLTTLSHLSDPETSTTTSLTSSSTTNAHILKIFKTKASKKGRELLKHDELLQKGLNNHNSLNHYSTPADIAGNNQTAESLQTINTFQILTNLYDHFYWQPSEIRTKVTTGCGLEMQAYLTALHGNYRWAQSAYDSSGRYRGQILFGSDKWLGQKTFCYELNRQLDPEKRKHFEFEFYIAVIAFNLKLPEKFSTDLRIGECLPKSCTVQDVQHIMEIDPHAIMLMSMNMNSTQGQAVRTIQVRTVPGLYKCWRELKFQIYVSILLTLLVLIITATWYQARLSEQRLRQPPISVISGSKIDSPATIHHISNCDHGKSFELYQMSNLSDNSNITSETDAEDNDKKSSAYYNGQHNLDINSNLNGATSTNNATSTNGTPHQQSSHDAEYRIETTSNAGATEPYEVKQKLSLHEEVLLCFAFQTNAKSILNIDEVKETQTSCVHGLRVISLLWTIMVHSYLQVFHAGENRFKRVIVERTLLYQLVGNATFSVDTFFFISGFLVTLLSLKERKQMPERTSQFLKKGVLKSAVVMIYRYIRLTPCYLFVIFFNDFATRQMMDISVLPLYVPPNNCANYWWRNILYINNFYPLNEICMIWSWYMANDMQFFIMATIILMLATRYPKVIALMLATFLASSWAISGVTSLRYHYTHKVARPFESFDYLYDKPWQRVGPYIMGMLAGFILSKVRTAPKISGRVNALLWLGSLGLLMLIIFGVWQGELDEVSTAFYVSIAHTAFGGAFIWIVLSCSWNLSPTMNSILSYRCLWPLSRLTYCTYLIHPAIMRIMTLGMEGTLHINIPIISIIFLGNAVFSFILAFLISALFEAPVIRLLKLLFNK